MQKDMHFYVTYALARAVGLSAQKAEKIAWSDQYTDELTAVDLHGIQTQTKASLDANWNDRQVQLTVLVPFHFVPGDDPKKPWVTTPDSPNANTLVQNAAGNDFQFGIALHALQDTFSHQGFSGWREKANDCFPWYYLRSCLPNIGHAEMGPTPDMIEQEWVDPRDTKRKKIVNKERALQAAKATFDALVKHYGNGDSAARWTTIEPQLKSIFEERSYDKRKEKLCALAGNKSLKFDSVNPKLEKKHKADFEAAASRHLSASMGMLQGLPW